MQIGIYIFFTFLKKANSELFFYIFYICFTCFYIFFFFFAFLHLFYMFLHFFGELHFFYIFQKCKFSVAFFTFFTFFKKANFQSHFFCFFCSCVFSGVPTALAIQTYFLRLFFTMQHPKIGLQLAQACRTALGTGDRPSSTKDPEQIFIHEPMIFSVLCLSFSLIFSVLEPFFEDTCFKKVKTYFTLFRKAKIQFIFSIAFYLHFFHIF